MGKPPPDQITALRRSIFETKIVLAADQKLNGPVHNQAASFGGDKNNVFLFGESAGAISVMDHAVMPSSAGLFTSVLSSQSGMMSCHIDMVYKNRGGPLP